MDYQPIEGYDLIGEHAHCRSGPQALTHLALISAAFDLDRRLSRAAWRA
jgi:hypothetical protein